MTQADLDNGSIVDSGVATAATTAGLLTSNTALATVTAIQSPALSVGKTATPSNFSVVGQTINYAFFVMNTGNVTLTGITVADTQATPAGTLDAPPVCPATTLAPGAGTTCTATYKVTQDDLDSGSISDTATASGVPPSGAPVTSAPASASVAATLTGTLALTKSASPATVGSVGDTVTYSFHVTNNSNVTVTGVSVADTQTPPAGSLTGNPACDATVLAPGATTTCTATSSVTQADIDNGSIDDTATASAQTPSHVTLTSSTAPASVAADQLAGISISKTADPTIVTDSGDTVTYNFVVSNTGNVSLANVSVTDTQSAPAGPLTTGPTCATTTLAPGALTTCSATYTVTQADIDNASINDSATASGTAPNNTVVTSSPDTATVAVAAAGTLALSKVVSPATVSTLGQTVNYVFAVTNNTNGTVTGLSVSDTQTSPAGSLATGPSCSVTTLAPGASTNCTGTYAVTQADIDNGSVDDTALANATSLSTATTLTSNAATATVNALQDPDIALTKTASPASISAAGNTVSYTFQVANTGNVTLTGVGVTDTQAAPAGPLTSGPTCVATTLAPGAATTCTATYTASQADIDAETIVDPATANATPPAGPPIASAPASAVVDVTPAPGVSITKTPSPATVTAAGQAVSYTFLVTNTGNVTLSGVNVADTEGGAAGDLNAAPSCPATNLAPGASTSCIATYTVTQADMDNGSIVDTATAAGIAPDGSTVTSSPASAVVAATQSGNLVLTKTASPASFSTVGQSINYTFVVTNNSNITVTGVDVADTQTAPAGALLSQPTCDTTSLAPSSSATCMASYVTTQSDLDHGSVDDMAVATATSPSNQALTSNTATATVTALQSPAVAVTKTASPTTVTAAGQSVSYAFAVTNDGNVTLNDIGVADTQTAPASALINPPTCLATSLAPGASTTCTASYTVTQADIDNGSVNDTATASGTTPSPSLAAVLSSPANAAVTALQTGSLALTKSVSPGNVTAAGQSLTYTFGVTNTGNVTLTNLTVEDAQSPPASALTTGPSCPATTLAPGASTTCTATYAVTQADIDNGLVRDMAIADAKSPTGDDIVSNAANAAVTATQTPGITVTKTPSPTTVSLLGQTVDYSFAVTNTGNVTLNGVGVADTGAPPAGSLTTGPSCPTDILGPGATTTCSGTYAVSQDDLDNGSVNDTATATGSAPSQAPVTSAPASATVTALQTGSLVLTKTASPVSISLAGQIITYTFAVTNDTNVTVSGVMVADTQSAPAQSLTTGPTCPSGDVAPGLTVDCTATYTVTQADVDNGSVNDVASATATLPSGGTITSNVSPAVVTSTQAPAVSLTKTASPATVTAAGQTVTYTFAITNNGNVTLTNLNVADTQSTPAGPLTSGPTCPIGPLPPAFTGALAPGLTADCTATYTVTQADMDKGFIDDTALATANAPSGTTLTSNAATAIVNTLQTPAITLTKTATPASVSAPGQVVTYSYQVINTGNVTLTGVAVTDTQAAPAGPLTSGPSCPTTNLAPGAGTTCTASYTVSQADIDNGAIADTAEATGLAPMGTTVVSAPASATVMVPVSGSLTLTKTASPTVISAAGQSVDYTFGLTNNANVTATSLSVADTQSLPAGSLTTGPTCAIDTLTPQASTSCSATYVATQADIDHGSIDDTASATALSPSGETLTSNAATASVTATSSPAITLTKTASPTAVSAAGQAVAYSFLVTNSGNVSVHDLAVTDTQAAPAGPLDAAPSCPSAPLAPGTSATCTGTYTVNQADINHGAIDDTAVATATSPSGVSVTSNQATAAITVSPPAPPPIVPPLPPPATSAGLTIEKTADPTSVSGAGQVVRYKFVVSNTGPVPLTGVRVTDAQARSGAALTSGPACPSSSLGPGATEVCSGTYTVTQADLSHGSVSDVATASGTPPTGAPISSSPSSATVMVSHLRTVPPGQIAALTLTKTASPLVVSRAGQVVNYSFDVQNTGDVGLMELSVSDTQTRPAGLLASGPTCPKSSLAVGETVICAGAYTVTQADIDHGRIHDTAVATATPAVDPLVASNTDEATVTVAQSPAITVQKTAEPSEVSAIGQLVRYTFAVSNVGNVTISDVAVRDNEANPSERLASGPSCPTGGLAPGKTIDCSARYYVTQADLDRGSITDRAVAQGVAPDGKVVTSGASGATVQVQRIPALTLVKTATPAAITGPGQAVRFHFTVTNSGNVTLSNLRVDDTQVASAGALEVPPSCPGTSAGVGAAAGPTLAPGRTIVCTATYIARHADLDRGFITDTARASATAPGSRVATLSASAGLRVGAQAPSNRGTSPSTTSPPMTAVSPPPTPTTSLPTTSLPTTSLPTTSLPTTSPSARSVPAASPTTTVPTSSGPTTTVPTTTTPPESNPRDNDAISGHDIPVDALGLLSVFPNNFPTRQDRASRFHRSPDRPAGGHRGGYVAAWYHPGHDLGAAPTATVATVLEPASFVGGLYGFSPGVGPKFGHRYRKVIADRPFGEEQLLRDL